MEVILLEDVNGLGKSGDVREVKTGYARNFLFPKKLALVSNSVNKKIFEAKRKKLELAVESEKKKYQELAEKLSGVSCTIPVNAGDDEKLFGSVTALDIAKALDQMGFEIDKKKIEIEAPIKSLGVYQVKIKLHCDVSCPLKVWVVKE